MTSNMSTSFGSWLARLAWCGLLVVAPGTAWTQERWQVGWTPSLSSGRYGADASTEVLYTPLTARRLFDAGDVAVVVPMLCVWGGGGLVVVNGSPVVPDQTLRTRADAAASAGRASTTPPTTRDGATTTTTRPSTGSGSAAGGAPVISQPTRACGLGDLVIRGRYYLSDGTDRAPSVAVRAHVKAPTASTTRGLGTGRPDEGVALEMGQRIAGRLSLLADAGYTWIGKPDGTDYRDTWWYDVGVGRDLARGLVNLSVFFEEYRAVLPGDVNARDILVAASIRGTGGWRVQAAGTVGLSEGAPDHGLTFGLSRRF
jgi:Putative MetA-pathway of phenol degradation